MAVESIIIIAIVSAQAKGISGDRRNYRGDMGRKKRQQKNLKKSILVILEDFRVNAVAKVESAFVNCSYGHLAPVKTVQNRDQLASYLFHAVLLFTF